MAKVGRPKKEINKTKLESAAELGAKRKDVVAYMDIITPGGCSDDTLERFIQSEYQMSFAEFLEKRKAILKIRLLGIQMSLAEKSAAMAIFLGKNILDQTDKMEETIKDGNKDKVWNINFVTGAEKDGH